MESSCEADDTIEYEIEVVQSSSSVSLASNSELQIDEVITKQSSNEENCQVEGGDESKVPIATECEQLEANKAIEPNETTENADGTQISPDSCERKLDDSSDNQLQVEVNQAVEQLVEDNQSTVCEAEQQLAASDEPPVVCIAEKQAEAEDSSAPSSPQPPLPPSPLSTAEITSGRRFARAAYTAAV